MNTLQFISIQHELGMATGLCLRLKPMLQHFTKVSIRRLGLAGMHFLFRKSAAGELVLGAADHDSRFEPFLSIPDARSDEVLDLVVANGLLFDSESRSGDYLGQLLLDEEYLHVFALGDVGLVILRRLNKAMESPVLQLLKPIISRLAISCHASIEHEQILLAIAAKNQAEETINFQIHHDDLTRLPNRRLLMERLNREISRCRRHHRFGGLLFLDLDRFKTVNDTLGHSVGDCLLTKVAATLKEITRQEDTVARVGGDEFVILLPEFGESSEHAASCARAVVEKILSAFSGPIYAGEHTFHITPSIGVDIFPDSSMTADDYLRHADMAMYQAKAAGRATAVFYDRKMSVELEERIALEKALRLAIRNDELELFYQPQFHADHGLVGAEALLRWRCPGKGDISPAVFVPVAEESGLILDIGDWVLRSACRDIRKLQEQGLPASFDKISINVSAAQFAQPDFVARVKGAVQEAGIDPGYLGIEMTEGMLIKHIDETVEKMWALNGCGIRFSIDDFGTGYSSLAYLTRFPIETLKIDQSFVRDVYLDKGNFAIVETIIALARNLGLCVIAEGVEVAEELECLKASGCDQYQGYYFDRPMPFSQLLNMLEPCNA